jgi:hypothetical protein
MSASDPRRTFRPSSLDYPIPRPVDEHTGCRREIKLLLFENARLAGDLSDSRARYYDLKRSAEIWISLYERQLTGKEPLS